MNELALTQYLIFELGDKCNLGGIHSRCPNSLGTARYAGLDITRPLEDATILECAITAYRKLGFTGMVGWHYYNEPTLQAARMLSLMDTIRELVDARFVLWTNGTGKLKESELRQFASIYQTPYNFNHADNLRLDGRMGKHVDNSTQPCLRVYVEFILDAFGNHHPCCFDWRGEASLGNVYDAGFMQLATRWRLLQDKVGMSVITPDAPTACQTCGFRGGPMPVLVPEIARRAEEERKKHSTLLTKNKKLLD